MYEKLVFFKRRLTSQSKYRCRESCTWMHPRGALVFRSCSSYVGNLFLVILVIHGANNNEMLIFNNNPSS